MKFSFKNIFSPKTAPQQVEKKSVDLSKWGPLLRLGNANFIATTPSGALSLYRESSAVSVPVNMIAADVGQLDPIYKIDNTILEDDPLTALLNKPSDTWTKSRFLKTSSVYSLVTGNIFIWAGGNISRLPLEIEPVSPDVVSISDDGEGATNSFHVTSGPHRGVYSRTIDRGIIRYLDGNLNELFLIKGTSTRESRVLGDSPLMPVGPEIKQIAVGNKHNNALLENGGNLSLLFALKGDLSDDQFEAAQEQIFGKYQGAGNAGSIGVVGADDVTVKEFGITPKDMDFKELNSIAKQTVGQQYQVPGVLLVNDAATFNNMDVAFNALYDRAVKPNANFIFEGLQSFLFMRGRIDKGELTFDESKLSSVRERVIKEVKERKEIGVETPNELRTLLGREGVDGQGADQIYLPANLIPIGDDIDTSDEPQVLDSGNDS